MKTFRRGRSTFNCETCGRLTRETNQSVGSNSCYECWEIAGLQNQFWDYGAEDGTIFKEAASLLEVIRKRGGDASKVTGEHPDLFPSTTETQTEKGTTVMTNVANTLDLLAAREGSAKRHVAEVLLKKIDKAVPMEDLVVAAYGKMNDEWRDPVVMVLKGIKKAIAVNSLPLEVRREKGAVTLASLQAKAKKSRKGK